MAITGLKTWADADALNTTNLNNDKTILEAKFNAGITTADLSATAGITNGQLANSYCTVVLSTRIDFTVAAAGLLAPNATSFFVLGNVPYDTAVETYYIKGVESMLYLGTGAGITAAVYNLLLGDFTGGGGAFVSAGTIVAGISTGTANNSTVYAPLITSFATANVATPKFFVLDVTTTGIGFNIGDTFCVTVKLTKALRA